MALGCALVSASYSGCRSAPFTEIFENIGKCTS